MAMILRRRHVLDLVDLPPLPFDLVGRLLEIHVSGCVPMFPGFLEILDSCVGRNWWVLWRSGKTIDLQVAEIGGFVAEWQNRSWGFVDLVIWVLPDLVFCREGCTRGCSLLSCVLFAC